MSYASEPSCVAETLIEDSSLASNNNFSFKQNRKDESKLKTSTMTGSHSGEFSITLDRAEKIMINGNGHIQKYTKTNNESLGTSKINETSINKEELTAIESDNGKRDESVISVEEDDDGIEITGLDITDIETSQKNTFGHLKPSKTETPKVNGIVEMDLERKREDSLLEDNNLYIAEDESEIFQYSLIEVGRRLWISTADKQHFTKGCLWSPDGTCLLAPVHLDGMHVMELPSDLYSSKQISDDRNVSNLTTAVHVKEGGTVYDFSWYPYMTSADPVTCCWLASRQHEPIQMWDAFSGDLRCSYRGYNEVDEVESAISLIFSCDGHKIIGGFKKTIKIFDTNIPGRSCSNIAVKNAVSCFALTKDNDNCVTTGTWTSYIHHYDLRAPKLGPLFTLSGHSGGITWLKYSPTVDNSWYLFSGARKDKKILQWDMRNYTEPIQIYERNVNTNQRIYYDLSPLNTWLASGDTKGLLRIWNLNDKDLQIELPIHQDCCNGVSFHPSLPIISTSSGQYHFVDVAEPDDKATEKIVDYENSLLMLWYGPSKEIEE